MWDDFADFRQIKIMGHFADLEQFFSTGPKNLTKATLKLPICFNQKP